MKTYFSRESELAVCPQNFVPLYCGLFWHLLFFSCFIWSICLISISSRSSSWPIWAGKRGHMEWCSVMVIDCMTVVLKY